MTYSIFHSTRALQVFLEVLAVVALAMAWSFPRAGQRFFRGAERGFGDLAAQRGRAIAVAALFPMVVRLLLLPVFPVPQPRVHDEFSYLLLGDTLAHGRLANPTPPYWEHFETEYELVRPAYASQYEPGQGVVLAAGQVLGGNPWWGVWISVGAMCGMLYWALAGAMPASWALFGSLMAGLQFGVFGFWMNSYFGGAVPAIGGCLIFGALTRRASKVTAALAGLGLIIVFATRPAEGAIWFAAAAIFLWRRRPRRIHLAVFTTCLAVGVAGLGFYNTKVTGKALVLPYSAYRQDYGTPQSYWWQPPILVSHFDHTELEANYEDQLRYWQRRYSAGALFDATWHRLRDFWRFYIGPFQTPALLFALFVIRRKRLRPWLWLSGVFILDHATYHAWYPQQSASESILIVWLLVEGWRTMRAWRIRHNFGLELSRNLTAGFAVGFAVLCIGLLLMPAGPQLLIRSRIWDTMNAAPDSRSRAMQQLARVPGKHLVFVHYSPGHQWYDEWVFNGADIPGSRIVFARMCSPESDRALAEAMSERDVWIASPDESPLLARVSSAQLLVASE